MIKLKCKFAQTQLEIFDILCKNIDIPVEGSIYNKSEELFRLSKQQEYPSRICYNCFASTISDAIDNDFLLLSKEEVFYKLDNNNLRQCKLCREYENLVAKFVAIEL